MALDKSQTSLIAKIMIVLLGVIMVISLAGTSLMGLLNLRGCTPEDGGASSDSVLDSISAQYRPVAESWEGILASDPESATVLVTLGNLHSDWALEVRQATQNQGVTAGAEVSYLELAISYYERAIQAGATQPEVRTDLAIAYYYGSRPDEAIALIEGVAAEYPDFPPAFYNGGIFYEAVGRTADSLTSFERYLEIDPDGTTGNPDYARERIAALQAQGGSTSP